jgi:hypothetical protein
MNRRDVLKLSSASLAGILMPNLAHTDTSKPATPVYAVFEQGCAEGRMFASTLEGCGIDTFPIQRDVSDLWYERLRGKLVTDSVVLGLTYEPEAFYLGSFAREMLHQQVVRIDVTGIDSGVVAEPVRVQKDFASLSCAAGQPRPDWPAYMARNFAEYFGYSGGIGHPENSGNTPVSRKCLTAWVIAPITNTQESKK